MKLSPHRNRFAPVVLWVIAAALSVTSVIAQPKGPNPKDSAAKETPVQREAARLNEEAQELYRQGDYRGAVKKLEQARKLDPNAKDLIYNQGLVYEKLTELDLALECFRRLLELEDDAKERERIQGVVRRLEGAKKAISDKPTPSASASATETVPEPPPTAIASAAPAPTVIRKRGKFDGWVIGTGGVALVAVGLGTYFGVTALTSQPSNPTTGKGVTNDQLQKKQQDAHSSALASDVLFATAAVAGGVSAVLYFTRFREVPVKVGAGPTRGGAGASVEVTF